MGLPLTATGAVMAVGCGVRVGLTATTVASMTSAVKRTSAVVADASVANQEPEVVAGGSAETGTSYEAGVAAGVVSDQRSQRQ